MWCSMRFAANAEGIRTKGRCVAWQPLTRETEEHKDRRTEDNVRVSRLPREHKNISFHKIHIRPLRGCRPRTNVRVASRDIRADAEAWLGLPLTRET